VPPQPARGFGFNIDVMGFGACNLSCPSCPVGNMTDVPNARGMLEPDLLRALLQKATTECKVNYVGLFNWSEPLLHPRLPELIRVVRSFGLQCTLSSNLNKLPNIEEVFRANPSSLRISCSGFRQENYGVTHRGGDIEVVKANMRKLVEARAATGASTELHMLYHRYRENLEDEVLMRNYCEELGINFIPAWAYFGPVEKVLAFVDKDESTTITQDDRDIIDRLLLPLPEAIEAAKRHKYKPCLMQEEQISIDCKGNVQLCCNTYDTARFTLGSYLELPITQIQQMKYAHDTCSKCIGHGLHVYHTYAAPEFDSIVHDRLTPEQQAIVAATPVYSNVDL